MPWLPLSAVLAMGLMGCRSLLREKAGGSFREVYAGFAEPLNVEFILKEFFSKYGRLPSEKNELLEFVRWEGEEAIWPQMESIESTVSGEVASYRLVLSSKRELKGSFALRDADGKSVPANYAGDFQNRLIEYCPDGMTSEAVAEILVGPGGVAPESIVFSELPTPATYGKKGEERLITYELLVVPKLDTSLVLGRERYVVLGFDFDRDHRLVHRWTLRPAKLPPGLPKTLTAATRTLTATGSRGCASFPRMTSRLEMAGSSQ